MTRQHSAFLVLGVLGLGAGAYFLLEGSTFATKLVPYTGSDFDYAFLMHAAPRAIMLYDGKEEATHITVSGAYEGNAQKTLGYSLESQRGAFYVVAAGIVAESGGGELLNRGLKAFEWGFAQMATDGTFPGERLDSTKEPKYALIHPISFFVEAAARSILLITVSEVDAAYKARANALVPKLHRAALVLAEPDNLRTFLKNAVDTNQLATVAAALYEAGLATRDASLMQSAKEVVREVLARQTAGGVFPEKKGFDTSYQTVSLGFLGIYASFLPEGDERTSLMSALQKGWDRFLTQVESDGSIDTSGNTRTMACGAPMPGLGPKGKGFDIIPLRLYYYAYLSGQEPTLAPVAERIERFGQAFDHAEQCSVDADN